MGKSLLPASVVIALGVHALKALVLPMPVMSLARLPATLNVCFDLAVDAAWVMVAWSGLDYAMERRAWNQKLRMTKQEMRDEMKETMGNPQVKRRMRQIQNAMRRRKVKADMSKASVVITNPTHYAVALEFSFESMQAPTVLTKGRNLHALRIREEAQWAGVPIVENPPLARSIYKTVEEGQPIPFELYAAVAGILAYLYRQQVEKAARERRAAEEAAAAAKRKQAFGGGL
jgi:flagellar biosynthetic protein FlhB